VPAAAAVALGVMTMSALAPPAAFADARPDSVQKGLNTLVHTDGVPGQRPGTIPSNPPLADHPPSGRSSLRRFTPCVQRASGD
jgi:hypothetical protein